MYEQAVVSFVDVLGFRKLVDTTECEQVDRILTRFQEFTADQSSVRHEYSPTMVSFSDSVIRVRHIEHPFNVQFPIGLVFCELLDLLQAQGQLIFDGILIRGGVTIGEVLVSENRVFGPGFIEAYDLESKFAVSPRIIVSPRLLAAQTDDDRLVPFDRAPEMELRYVQELLYRDNDGNWFIDYLRAYKSELDDLAYYPEYLLRHRRIILNEGAGLSTDSPLATKYAWLARYHNSVVDPISDEWYGHYGVDRAQLRVNSSDLPMLLAIS